MEYAKKIRIQNILSLISNILINVFTWYSILAFIFGDTSGNMTLGSETFRYFTNLSNILVALMAMFVIPYNISAIKSGKNELPLWVMMCKFTATISVTVTFLTVIFFLGPTQGYDIMFAGPCLFLHLITPLVAIISTICFETPHKVTFKLSFWGIAPTFVYSIVYLFTVGICKVWPDFYGFTFGGKMWTIPFTLIAMYIATYIFSFIVYKLQNLAYRKLSKNPADDKLPDELFA